MYLFCVYENVDDYPGKYIARMRIIESNLIRITETIYIGDTLSEIRKNKPSSMFIYERHSGDRNTMVECWV